MSDRRRRFKESEVIDVLLLQGATIPCYRCPKPILSGKDCQREHLHEKGLGGACTVDNARYSHIDCHKTVTFGTPATTVGSSVHKVAKAKRMEKKRTEDLPADTHMLLPKTARQLRKGGGAAIKSQGFQTNRNGPFKQPMRGPPVRRNT
jgi:hypothetical protein